MLWVQIVTESPVILYLIDILNTELREDYFSNGVRGAYYA